MGDVIINVSTHDNDTKDLNLSLEGTVLKGTLGATEATVDLSGIIPANAKDRFLKSGRYEKNSKRIILVTGAEGEQDNEIAIPLEDLFGLNLPTTCSDCLKIDSSREVRSLGDFEFTPVTNDSNFKGYVVTDSFRKEYIEVIEPNKEDISGVLKVVSNLTNEVKGYEYTQNLEIKFSKTPVQVTPLDPVYKINNINFRELTEEEKGKLDKFYPAEDYVTATADVEVIVDNIVDFGEKEFANGQVRTNFSLGKNLEAVLKTITPVNLLDGGYEMILVPEADGPYETNSFSYYPNTKALSFYANKTVTFLVKKSSQLFDFLTTLKNTGQTTHTTSKDNFKFSTRINFTDGSSSEDFGLVDNRKTIPIISERNIAV